MNATAKPDVKVTVTRRFTASPERVYDAWLTPEMISQFMFGPKVRDEKIISLMVDARVGGTFSFVVNRQGQEFDHIGEYLEMNRPNRLVFTWGIKGSPSSRVELDITKQDGVSVLTLTHFIHPDWADFAARTEQGWTMMIGKLVDVLG